MVQRLYAIYDLKAEAPVGVLQWANTDEEATRRFALVVKAPGTLIHDHPGDFVLLHVGDVDFTSMAITPNAASRMQPIANGADIARALTRVRNSEVEDQAAVA